VVSTIQSPTKGSVPFSAIADATSVSAQEATALVLAAVESVNQAIPGMEGLPLPEPGRVLLNADGCVTVTAPAPPTDDEGRMLAAATLLRRLLSLDSDDGRERAPVPGALLMLLARASGTIDLPAPSFDGLCEALRRIFPAADRGLLLNVYRRTTGAPIIESAVPGASPLAPATAPDQCVPATEDVPSASERRRQSARISELRRELRLSDRSLFEALASFRHGARRFSVAAAAISAIALATGALITRGAVALLDGSAPRVQTMDTHAATDQPPTLTTATPARPASSHSKAVRPEPVEHAAPPTTRPAAVPRTVVLNPTGDRTHLPFGSTPRPLVDTIGQVELFSPSFGPDGDLVFHRGRERGALMHASFGQDGVARVTTLLEDDAANYHPVLSPDGARLAYDSDRDGTRGVFVARRDGHDAVRVSGEGFAAVPRWSPDGRRLAFVRSEAGRPNVWNVWIADLERGSLTRVSHHTVGQAWSASWFPDGRRVAYTVEDRLVIADLATGRSAVARAPVHGALLRTPAVSPSGDTVALQVHGDGVWLFDVASGTMRRVDRDRSAEEFSWSPNGRRLAYHSRRGERWSLWQLDVPSAASAPALRTPAPGARTPSSKDRG
jgi:Tol biopolymer transport system component